MASAVARAVRAPRSTVSATTASRCSIVAGSAVLHDPWAARDAYVDVVLGAISIDEFAARWVRDESPDATIEALTLLEAQRHAMLMYTSCGWFFNDIAGLETVQVMRYAARAVGSARTSSARAPTSTRSSTSSTQP